MPNPTIGEIVRDILSNDATLDMLEARGWYADIDTIHEEEFSVLESPNKRLKIRQWDFPQVFMQYVRYEEEIVYHTRALPGHNPFEHPLIHISGPWEEELRRLYTQKDLF